MLRPIFIPEQRLLLKYTPISMLPTSLLYTDVKAVSPGIKLGTPEPHPPQVVVYNYSVGAKTSNPLQTLQTSMENYLLSMIMVKVLRYTFLQVLPKHLTRHGQPCIPAQQQLQKGQPRPLPRRQLPRRPPPQRARSSRRHQLQQQRTTTLLLEVALEVL